MDIDLENFITWKAMMDGMIGSVDIASFKKFVKFSKLKAM